MASILKKLTDRNLITPPAWLPQNVQYEVIMGSVAYGVSTDMSDVDVQGFAIAKKEDIFPHLAGYLPGFGKQPQRFDEYEQHHVYDPSAQREYDFKIYNIIKFFELCRQGNPNMIDALFVPQNCILTITQVGNLVRENRRLFLSKLCWPKFKGYAYGQMHKLSNKEPEGKRKALVEKFGYDVKFAYHVVRLLNEVESILVHGDLDLQANREQLKSIRRGEWSELDIVQYFNKKESELESIYLASKLPREPDENVLKTLLLNCLEIHYGSLDKVITREDMGLTALKEINSILERLRSARIV